MSNANFITTAKLDTDDVASCSTHIISNVSPEARSPASATNVSGSGEHQNVNFSFDLYGSSNGSTSYDVKLLRAQLSQAQMEKDYEIALRKKAEKNLVKLAKQLNFLIEKSKGKEVQLEQVGKANADLGTRISSLENKLVDETRRFNELTLGKEINEKAQKDAEQCVQSFKTKLILSIVALSFNTMATILLTYHHQSMVSNWFLLPILLSAVIHLFLLLTPLSSLNLMLTDLSAQKND